MKRLLESKVRLPDWDSLNNLGDFRIFLDDPDEEFELSISEKHTSGQILPEQPVDFEVQMSNTAVHPAEYSTYDGLRDQELENAMNSFRLPDKNQQYEKIPQHLKESQLIHEENHPRGKPPPGQPVARKQLPGTSVSYVEGMRASRDRREPSLRGPSISSSYFDGRRQADSPTLGIYPPVSRSSGSPTPSSPISSMQFGVPPLQTQRAGGGLMPRTPPSLKNDYTTRPLPPINTSHHPFSLMSLNPRGPFGNHTRQNSESGGQPISGYRSPVSPATTYEHNRGSVSNEPVDYGVRPGETEIMKGEFQRM
jgi:hypothetical protein